MFKLLKIAFFGTVGIAVIIGAWFVVNKYIYQSKATSSPIKIYFDPTTLTAHPGINTDVSVMFEGDVAKKVSAATIEVVFDNTKLQLIQEGADEGPTCNDLETKVTQVQTASGSSTTIKWTKVAIKKDSELPSGLFCFGRLRFKGLATGSAQINLPDNLNNFNLVGPSGAMAAQKDGAKSRVNVMVTADLGTPTLDFSIKLQGVVNRSATVTSIPLRITAAKSDGSFTKTFDNVTATASAGGVWQGALVMAGVTPGPNYRILVKGPRHLKRKYCHLTVTADPTTGYTCNNATITLVKGINKADFTAAPLLVGDLPPQDGLLNARDASVLRQQLFQKTADAINKADFNHDGIVNTIDYSLMIQSMQLKYDEEE